MARLVDNSLKKPLAEALLFGELKDGGVATADVRADGEALVLSFTTTPAPSARDGPSISSRLQRGTLPRAAPRTAPTSTSRRRRQTP